MPIFRRFFSAIRKNKTQRLTDTSDDDDDEFLDISSPSSPSTSSSKPPPLVDSAFCASHISGSIETGWEDKLEYIHQHGEQLSLNWYQSLDELASMMDKVTSPFQNTNRVSLHQVQKFIELYLDDWKSRRYENQVVDEKLEQIKQQFSDQVDLKNCVVRIQQLEKDLYNYRCTMDDQLMGWDTKHKDQQTETWKHHCQAYQQTSNQMESKFKALLETCSPKPDEYTCAVCLCLFTEPITLQPCLHTFCKSCVQHIYCTCQLTRCDSACHDPANRPSNMVEDDDDVATPKRKLSRQFSGSYKPRYRHLIADKRISRPPSPTPTSTPPASTQQPKRRYSTLLRKGFSLTTEKLPPPSAPATTTTPTTTITTLRQEKVTLQCDCPLSWSVPPAAQCPLCRHPFGPEDCRLAVGLDNLIRFYFPRHDRVRQKYDARERQLNRRRSLSAWRFLPQNHALPSVPLPPRRQSPTTPQNHYPYHRNNAPMSMISIPTDLANLARRSFIV